MANWDYGNNLAKLLINFKEWKDVEWRQFMKNEIKKDYFKELYQKLKQEALKCKKDRKYIYPTIDNVFAIFKMCPLSNIKVVIVGQDCYINHFTINKVIIPQAMGFSFSVPDGFPHPPSLKNIFKELKNDIPDFVVPNSGNLTEWVYQGVFLLNSALTVEQSRSNSHSYIWQQFTDNVIKYINDNRSGIVFILWGRYAQTKEKYITNNNYIIKCAHPSPLSANNGFFGSRCFSRCNKLLNDPINWKLNTSE